MNDIASKFLLTEDKFMLEVHLRQFNLPTSPVEHLLKIKTESNNLCKQEIQDIFIEMN